MSPSIKTREQDVMRMDKFQKGWNKLQRVPEGESMYPTSTGGSGSFSGFLSAMSDIATQIYPGNSFPLEELIRAAAKSSAPNDPRSWSSVHAWVLMFGGYYMDVFLLLRLLYYAAFPGTTSFVIGGSLHALAMTQFLKKNTPARVVYEHRKGFNGTQIAQAEAFASNTEGVPYQLFLDALK
jgi:hypothetical protein